MCSRISSPTPSPGPGSSPNPYPYPNRCSRIFVQQMNAKTALSIDELRAAMVRVYGLNATQVRQWELIRAARNTKEPYLLTNATQESQQVSSQCIEPQRPQLPLS